MVLNFKFLITIGYGNFLRSIPSAFKRRLSKDDDGSSTAAQNSPMVNPRRNRSKSIAGPASCESALKDPNSIIRLGKEDGQDQLQPIQSFEQKYPKMKPRRKGSVFFALGTK